MPSIVFPFGSCIRGRDGPHRAKIWISFDLEIASIGKRDYEALGGFGRKSKTAAGFQREIAGEFCGGRCDS
jgi:hypothetical protein